MTVTRTHTATLSPGERQVLTAVSRGLVTRQSSTGPSGPYDFGKWLQRAPREPYGSNTGHDVTRTIDDLMRRGLVRPAAGARKGRRAAVLTADGHELLDGAL